MASMKVLVLAVACVAANLLSVSGECSITQKAVDSFDPEKFQGPFVTAYLPSYVLKAYKHWKVVFTYSGPQSKIAGTADQVQSDGSLKEMKVGGSWLTYNKEPEFGVAYDSSGAQYNTNYTVVAVDYDCYVLLQGCPEGAPSPLTALLYRDLTPSEECFKKGKAELEKRDLLKDVEEEDNMTKYS